MKNCCSWFPPKESRANPCRSRRSARSPIVDVHVRESPQYTYHEEDGRTHQRRCLGNSAVRNDRHSSYNEYRPPITNEGYYNNNWQDENTGYSKSMSDQVQGSGVCQIVNCQECQLAYDNNGIPPPQTYPYAGGNFSDCEYYRDDQSHDNSNSYYQDLDGTYPGYKAYTDVSYNNNEDYSDPYYQNESYSDPYYYSGTPSSQYHSTFDQNNSSSLCPSCTHNGTTWCA